MPENLQKYTASVKKTIEVLNQTTTSIESKIKELVLVLEAANQGILTTREQVQGALEGVAKGKFDTKPVLQGYLKQLQLSDESAGKLVSRWEELQSISLETLKNSEGYGLIKRELLVDLDKELTVKEDITEEEETQQDIYKERLDLVSDLADQYKKFQASVNSNSKQIKDINIDLTKGVSITKGFFDLADSTIPNLFSPEKINLDDIKKHSDDLNKIQSAMNSESTGVQMSPGSAEIDFSSAISGIIDTTTLLRNQIDEEFKLRKEKLKSYVALSMGYQQDMSTGALTDIQTQTEILGTSANMINFAIEDRIKLYDDIAYSLHDIKNLSESELTDINNKISLLNKEEKILLGQYASSKSMLQTNADHLDLTNKQYSAYSDIFKITSKFEDQFSQIGTSAQTMLDIIPYSMQRMLGLSNIQSQITNALNVGLQKYAVSLANGESKLMASTKALKTFGGSITSMLGPVGLLIIGIAAIVGLVKGLEDKVSNVSKELGVSRATSKKMVEDSLQLVSASGNRFITEEQILEIQKKQVESNGRILDLSKQSNQELVATATNAEQAFGILATDAMDLMTLFKQIGADDSLSQRLLADIGYMSEAAGIAPNIISKDLIEGSKEVSLYFAGMPKQAAKAAIQIRRMGMSIKQAGQIADKMLNIEGFMTDMTELAAMSGGKLNLSEAFDLRMAGDIEGMTKSIMNQIGSLQDFNEMSEFTQRKLATTLGMEVGDLRKSIKLKEMSSSLDKDQMSILQANLDKVGDIGNMNLENMKAKAEELNSTKKLAVAFDKIKAILYKALVPIIESMSDALGASTGILDAIGAGFKIIGGIIKFITPLVKGFFLPFQWAGELITWLVTGLEKLFGKSTDAISSIDGMNSGLNKTSDIIGKIGMAIGALFGARYLGKLTGINKLIGNVFSGLGGQAAAAGEMVTEQLTKPSIFKTITDKFKSLNPFSFLQKKSENVDVTQTISREATTTNVTDTGESTSKLSKLSDFVSKIGEKIQEDFGKLKDLIVSIADTIKQVLVNLGEGIGKFFESVFTGMANGLNKFQPKALLGAAALVIMSGALWTTAKAMQEFNSVNFSSLVMAGAAIGGLILAVEALGAVMGSGVGAVGLGLGIAAMLAMTGVLYLFGKALNVVGDAITKFEPIVSSILSGISGIVTSTFDGITKLMGTLADMDISNLIMIGPALMGIAAGLAAISAGSIIQGLTSLFTTDPFEKLEKIALLANPMSIVANSIKVLSDSLTQLATILGSIDLKKLKDVGDNSLEINKQLSINTATQSSLIGGSTPIVSTPSMNMTNIAPATVAPIVPTVGESYMSNDVQNTASTETTNVNSKPISTAKMERLLSELIDGFAYYASRPVPAIIGRETQKELNNINRGLNNR